MSAKPQTLYTKATATTLEQKLDQLAAMPKGLSLRTLIERLRPKIKAAQDAGHTYEDIVQTLGESGVQIKVNTLKQYLREPRTEGTEAELNPALTTPTPTSRKTRRASVTAATPKPETEQTVTTSESQTEPKIPSALVHTQVDQLEDNSQTARATNTATQSTPLTNTNVKGFQEMLPDDVL